MNNPIINRYEGTNNFEVVWVYNKPEEKTIKVFVNGVRKSRGKDYALGFSRGQIIIYFTENIEKTTK